MCEICLTLLESSEKILLFSRYHHKVHKECFDLQIHSACQPSGTRPITCAQCTEYISLNDINK